MKLCRDLDIDRRGAVDKTIVAGVKDRAANEIRAGVVPSTDAETPRSFVRGNVEAGAAVRTDEHGGYRGPARDFTRETVRHGVGGYVRGMASTQGIESFWNMPERAHKGTVHKLSARHLDRRVMEFSTRRGVDMPDRMAGIVRRTVGKRLRHRDPIADNGPDLGARA